MNDRQRNRLAMYRSTSDYVTNNSTIWSAIPATQTALDALDAKIAEIDSLVSKQEAPTTGMTQNKAEARDLLEESTLAIADLIAVYAHIAGDSDLQAQMDLTPSGLDTSSEQRVDGIAERVHTAATTNLEALADYGVTQAAVDELQDRIDAFRLARQAPDAAEAEQAGITEILPDHFRETTNLLNDRLDKLMTPHRASHPEFYAGYQSARVIYDLRATSPSDPPSNP